MSDSASSKATDTLARRGLMFIMSSPSGAGKTTISRMLLEHDPHICISVSCTTRPPRPGEVDGKDYHFVDRTEFDRMVENEEFLEWAEVFGHCYGTPKAQVKAGLKDGQDYLFDIDWQGTQQLADRARDDLVTVFILPPSIAELERRLTTRAQDSAEVVAKRMAKAADEMSHYAEYDYVLVNEDVDRTLADLEAILRAERLRRRRRLGLSGFVNVMREGAGR